MRKCQYCGTTISPRFCKGYCNACYQRLKKTGDIRLKCLTGPHAKGYSVHPLRYTWVNMKTRCYNKHSKSYSNYGGRGIKVCDRWLEKPNGFWNFVEDMAKLGERPKGWSLDRIDVNGNYCLENVRWANSSTQAKNRRNSFHRGICLDGNSYRAYIDHNGNREYAPRHKSLEQAIAWRLAKEKEYGLSGLDKCDTKRTLCFYSQDQKAEIEQAKLENSLMSQI